MPLYLDDGESVVIPPPGRHALSSDADGNPFVLGHDGRRVGLISGMVAGDLDYSGVSDSSAVLLSWLTSPPVDQGAEIQLRPGIVKVSPDVLTVASRKGITLRGSGRHATTLMLGTASGHGIAFDHCYSQRVTDMTIASTSKRAGGTSLRVIGGHPDYAIDQATYTNAIFERVDFINQFTGFEIFDDDAGSPGGAWGVTFKDCFYYDGADDADPFLINSPRGGIHIIKNVFVGPSSVPDSTHRPATGLRIRASNDFTIDRFSQILCKDGLKIDAAAGKIVRAGKFFGCYFDSNNTYGVRIDASAGTVDQLQFTDLWSASNQHNVSLTGTHDLIKFVGGQFFRALSGWGALIDGGTRTELHGVDFGGVGLGGIWVTGSSADFSVKECLVGPAYDFTGDQPIGIQIDAGCDHYTVTGNNFRRCTTPITNTPGTSAGRRIVQDNVIA